MKVKMNTGLIPIFSGTYYTQWKITEYDEDGQELDLEYKFSEFMDGIAKAYDADSPQILRNLRLHAPFIDAIKFPGTHCSPKEYNFSTDVLDFVFETDGNALRRFLNNLRDKDIETCAKLETFLFERFSSRDGFISFTPNNFWDLRQSIVRHASDFEQALAALITFLCGDELREIEEYVYDYWQANGYGGLNYTIIVTVVQHELSPKGAPAL